MSTRAAYQTTSSLSDESLGIILWWGLIALLVTVYLQLEDDRLAF